ncbi:hypothetical protein [Iningainema tapete]|uniref:Uncharacterized protein n=1 Tax=Iningainema tapete BLCC-T55 TaxID=2748662 RepID=A0A8J7C9U0_9CYAN|nr:hypothetical protein [Iningainema tapete]MBD2776356.1 hypothetical protein [Iningainema tapete BLCC-T55]
MTLTNDIKQFQMNTAKSMEILAEAYRLANKLSECSVDELPSQFAQLQNLCEQALAQTRYTASNLIEINLKWGSAPIQHYLSKQLSTGDATGSTVKVEHSPLQLTTGAEKTTQPQAGDLTVLIESAKEFIDKTVDVSGQFLNQAVKTGKNLPATMMIATSLTGVALTRTVNFVDKVISPLIELNNRVATKPGMPLSENSWLAIIKEISDKTEEYFGIDGEVVAAYEMQKEQEEDERERRL